MAVKSRSKDRRKSQPHTLHKPRGVVHPRIVAVGPEHFAFVCVDCAKARSKIMLADFYGRVLLEPTTVEHNRSGFETALISVRTATARHQIKDVIVVIERTGRYHGPVRRAFGEAGFEVRIIHPYTTKQYRLPADPGNKTDDTDLSAIHRAAVNGFGLAEPNPTRSTSNSNCWPGTAASRCRSTSPSSSRCSSIFNRSCRDIPGASRTSSIPPPPSGWPGSRLGRGDRRGRRRRLEPTGSTGRPEGPTLHPREDRRLARSAPSAEEPASLHHRIFLGLDADSSPRPAASGRSRANWPGRWPAHPMCSS